MSLTLHSYWRSSAAWRVRIALALKGVTYSQITHDLRSDQQRDPEFLALNPQGLVPALETGGVVLTQSMAMIEWLEETFPHPALLPQDALSRAHVRAMAQVIACDIHPLNNLRVLQSLRTDLAAEEASVSAWIARWITAGFTTLEAMVRRFGKGFAFGDTPGLVDCCLIPQLFSARRFDVDLTAFPRLIAVEARCASMPTFLNAAPATQPDAAR